MVKILIYIFLLRYEKGEKCVSENKINQKIKTDTINISINPKKDAYLI